MAASNAALKLPSTDTAQAAGFLSVLSRGDPNARFSFQTFGEGASSGDKSLTRVLHGTFAEHAQTLSDLNDRGAGVFVMVNQGDGRGRKASNVTRVRSVFADFDGASMDPLEDIPHKPHLVVESSPDRWHTYWLADDLALADFGKLQAAIAARFGSDGKVKDVSRVMRLPGFLHRKHGAFMTRVAQVRDLPAYSEQELSGLFLGSPLPNRTRLASTIIPEGTRNETLFGMASGFVRQGLPATAINDRMQKINADRCNPPLGADEVDVICTNAVARGSTGFTYFPHSVSDSPGLLALRPAAVAILLAMFRKHNGGNNGKLSLPWNEFEGRHLMNNSGTFYKHLKELCDAGFLVKTGERTYTPDGTKPATYAIPDKYVPK